MTPSITTRAATPDDDAFLFELFQAVHAPEFALAPLAPARLDMLMRMQFAGQKQTYNAQYPGGNHIIQMQEKPIGRIWLHRAASGHHLVDIALLPEFQNRGIGAALIGDAIAVARAAGARLSCSVALTNPGSLRFHQRMGFRIVSQDELFYQLAVEL
jgi:ribosomal protein S18 acetylase RimI-like enzyme